MPVDPAVIALSLGLAPTEDNSNLVANVCHLGRHDTTPSSKWATPSPLRSTLDECVSLVCDLPPFSLTASTEVSPEVHRVRPTTPHQYTEGQEMAHLLCGMPPQTQSTAAAWKSDVVYPIPSLRAVLSRLPSPSTRRSDSTAQHTSQGIPEELIGF